MLYDNEVVVYDEGDKLMEPDRDYVWHPSNGTIQTVEGGRLAGDANATISYGYNRPTEGQQGMAKIAAMLLGNIEVLGFAFILGLFLVYIGLC